MKLSDVRVNLYSAYQVNKVQISSTNKHAKEEKCKIQNYHILISTPWNLIFYVYVSG